MISKIRRKASQFLCITLLGLSVSCASTDPEDAQDAALAGGSASEAESATADTDEGAEAAAESDFGQEGAQPNSESTVPPLPEQEEVLDEETPPEEATADTSQAPESSAANGGEANSETADPFAGQENLGTTTEPTPEEQLVDQATAEVASDSPAEPALIQPTPATEGTNTDAAAAPAEPAQADPFARFSEGGETDAVAFGSSAAAAGTLADASTAEDPAQTPIQADPFAQAATESAQTDATEVFGAGAVASQGMSDSPESTVSESASTPTGGNFSQTSNLEYLVAPGDSLTEIAVKVYGSPREWQTIAQTNSLRAPFVIFPGDMLKIQTFGNATSYAEAYQNVPETLITVQRGETLSSISKRLLGNGSSWKYIWKINEAEIPNPNVLKPGQVIRFKDFRSVQVSL